MVARNRATTISRTGTSNPPHDPHGDGDQDRDRRRHRLAEGVLRGPRRQRWWDVPALRAPTATGSTTAQPPERLADKDHHQTCSRLALTRVFRSTTAVGCRE